MAIFDNLGGSGGGGIRYDSATDMIQLKDNSGEWKDYACGGLLTNVLYDNGIQNVQFDLGHVWRFNSYSYKDSEDAGTSIKLTGSTSAGSSATGTTDMIDVTEYNYLIYEVTNNSTNIELEIDISDLIGEHYIGIAYRYADEALTFGLSSTKNIGTGAVRTSTKSVSAHTTYLKKVYLRK